MITLHRLNGKEFVLNAEHIKFVEATPDTVITLSQGDEKFMVKETVDEVVSLAVEYKRKWLWTPPEHRK
ncbi:MAG: flagellar FlbD family protein [Bdellovibrionales bacterium]|nr:flagellar FlbD family protein [Bdellovibrionales bacterium]